MKIAIFSLRRTFVAVLVVLLILGGAVGCERKLCEVVVVNEAPSLGLAQRYFVEGIALTGIKG